MVQGGLPTGWLLAVHVRARAQHSLSSPASVQTLPMASCAHGWSLGAMGLHPGSLDTRVHPMIAALSPVGANSKQHRHSFTPGHGAGRRFQRHKKGRQGRARHVVRADLVSPTLFSDALAPLAALAAPVIDPASSAVMEAFKSLIFAAPSELQPLLVLAGTDLVTTLQLAPSSETVFRLAVGTPSTSVCLHKP